MRPTLCNVIFASTALVALGCIALPAPAQAQFGIPGLPGGVRIKIPNIQIQPGGGSQRSGRRSRSNDDDSGSSNQAPSQRDRDRALASIAPPTKDQTTVLKSITASGVIGVVGAKAQNEVGQAF